jgi:hypothetical protein
MVVCTGFITQNKDQEYSHTKFSFMFAQHPGPGDYFQMLFDESFLMIDNFHLYLDEKGLKEPADQRYSPYAWKSKQEGTTIWEIMAQHPARFAAFQAGLAHASASVPLTGFYDFSKLNTTEDVPVLVDLGGGVGDSILRILEAHPDLDPSKFVLQELSSILAESKARKVLPEGVVLMEHDFFGPQPIKGNINPLSPSLLPILVFFPLANEIRRQSIHVPPRNARLLRRNLHLNAPARRGRHVPLQRRVTSGLRLPRRRQPSRPADRRDGRGDSEHGRQGEV